jgi:hypothetical protein
MKEQPIKLADLPAKWEGEADEIDQRLEAKEVTGDVWEARRDILVENAVDLREALDRHHRKGDESTETIPSSAHRLADWLWQHGYPQEPRPQTNDICDWALAKLIEQDRVLNTQSSTLTDA